MEACGRKDLEVLGEVAHWEDGLEVLREEEVHREEHLEFLGEVGRWEEHLGILGEVARWVDGLEVLRQVAHWGDSLEVQGVVARWKNGHEPMEEEVLENCHEAFAWVAHWEDVGQVVPLGHDQEHLEVEWEEELCQGIRVPSSLESAVELGLCRHQHAAHHSCQDSGHWVGNERLQPVVVVVDAAHRTEVLQHLDRQQEEVDLHLVVALLILVQE